VLTTAEVQGILSRVTYKPGWTIAAYDGRYEGQHLVITTVVPDSTNPEQDTTLDVHSMLPPMRDERALLDWILWRCIRIECHEAREWLQVDGKPWSDPHAEYADQDR
jgi:hypothetical protein